MKVTFKNILQGYQGKCDELVFYWDSRLQRILARRLPNVKITARHIAFGDITKNLMAIHPSEAYKDDLKTYAERCYKVPQFGGVRPLWNNLYMQLMHALKRGYPALNLLTLTKSEIYAFNLPCISVKRAVEAGLLPEVRGYETLTGEI